MTSFESVFAVVLLTSWELPAAPSQAWQTALAAPIRAHAVADEIVSIEGIIDFPFIWETVYSLWAAPHLGELDRFPPQPFIIDSINANRRYKVRLLERLPHDLLEADAVRAEICEVDRLYLIYDTLRDAMSAYYWPSLRRTDVAKLRELLGPTAFYSGWLPPSVP